MQKYSAEGYVIGPGDESTPTFYSVEEVDARIDELERALKSTATVLSQMLQKHNILVALASEALLEADRALRV
jgi:hypothetical protein